MDPPGFIFTLPPLFWATLTASFKIEAERGFGDVIVFDAVVLVIDVPYSTLLMRHLINTNFKFSR